MYAIIPLLAGLTLGVGGPGAPVHSGRAGQLAVRPPRLDGAVVIDGQLDEPQWKQAAVLTGFSQFTPLDGLPAADSTEVLVWYAHDALYLGIRAFDTSAVHATLATRDDIFRDDNLQIYLSTFNDGRQATFFAVNPLGVQADGALNENGSAPCGGGGGCAGIKRQQPDLSQDFIWDSKGRIVPGGYEVEIRIPFKSIRFQMGKTQTWGIQFVRVVQRTGQEQTWTPARQGASSFLAQSGRLEGLTELHAGHVLDIVPTLTSRMTGAPASPGAPFNYDVGKPQIGGDIRYGLTPNLTFAATAHPDFSQVESDVTQFAFDPRQAVFYPEKRPFFLEGSDQFDAPANLIYTRRIVQPVFASKVAGKVGDNQVGVLAAVDDPTASGYNHNPVFAIFRGSHDLGPGSRIGAVWTEQHDGPETNRVGGIDGRIVVHQINSFTFFGAMSHDAANGVSVNAPIFSAGYRRDGAHFRAAYGINGVSPDFITRSGFISQAGVGNVSLDHSYTWLWHDHTVQSFTADVYLAGHYVYDSLIRAGGIQNKQLHFNFGARVAGGWNLGAGYFRETFGYDPSIYTNYGLLHPDGSVTPFTGGGQTLPNNDYVLNAATPTWKHVDMNFFVLAGLNDENYGEWASGRLVVGNFSLTLRPTDQLRIGLNYSDSRVYRPDDNSRELIQDVAVVGVEYQLSRAFQLRLIGQYSINARDSLRDDQRTNLPIVFSNGDGTWSRAASYDRRGMLLNFLFTYLPNPGTVVYLGYGSLAQYPDQLGRNTLAPVQNDFFVKLSYLWRKR